ncbi:adenine nucleotide alpha hydrolase [Pedobacter aquatilis]|uniref:adenine nucleotide alpha hydrolase n=1 Tax=Pedobacter aquatilis TaxID=351343 RepID=UPI0025B3B411|nr:adenine nucleotide alpha hydrolase [Pedobacter aquatilis]MDN3585757.1 adenine nucleotide alpha hydrolase [Pedobacter aquatilis]
MQNKTQCIFNWSGGKDSTLALHYALQDNSLEIKYLVTTITEKYNRVSMHGVRESLLIKQAESIGIPLYQIRLPEMPDMKTYDDVMKTHMSKFKAEGITHSIFGDIFLEDLKKYREEKLSEIGMKAIFPLWSINSSIIIDDFLTLEYKTIIVCAQQNLKYICGKVLDNELINSLPSEIDSCGENGEFHTFAFDGPLFKNKISFTIGELVFRTYSKPLSTGQDSSLSTSESDILGFWYVDLE